MSPPFAGTAAVISAADAHRAPSACCQAHVLASVRHAAATARACASTGSTISRVRQNLRRRSRCLLRRSLVRHSLRRESAAPSRSSALSSDAAPSAPRQSSTGARGISAGARRSGTSAASRGASRGACRSRSIAIASAGRAIRLASGGTPPTPLRSHSRSRPRPRRSKSRPRFQSTPMPSQPARGPRNAAFSCCSSNESARNLRHHAGSPGARQGELPFRAGLSPRFERRRATALLHCIGHLSAKTCDAACPVLASDEPIEPAMPSRRTTPKVRAGLEAPLRPPGRVGSGAGDEVGARPWVAGSATAFVVCEKSGVCRSDELAAASGVNRAALARSRDLERTRRSPCCGR
jgi:hypothetical protein